MRHFICLIVLCFIVTLSSFAQQALKLSTQSNIAPRFQLNKTTHNNALSNGLKLSLYDIDKAPAEFGLYYTRGYDRSIAFSYGILLTFIFEIHKNHWLKPGFSNGRLKMDQYKNEYEEGGIQEDNLHKTYFSYLEWEWLFARNLSLLVKAGYRFLESETTILHNETVETIPGTDYEVPDFDKERNTRFYGSGFEFGLGLSVSIY